MNLSWLKPFLIRSRHWVVKNAPHILMGVGTSSSVAAIVYAAKSTPKAMTKLFDASVEKTNETIPESGEMAELTLWEKTKVVAPIYAPSILMEIFSLTCFWSAHGIDIRRQALLAGLCSTFEQTLIEYQNKVAEMFGKDKEKEVRNAIAQDHVDRNPPPAIVYEAGTDVWCYYKGYKFRSSYYKLRDIQNMANKELINHMYLSECDLLWLFDPDHDYITPSDESRHVGWCVDEFLEFDILPCMDPNHNPALTIEIRNRNGREYPPLPGYTASL